MNQHDRCIILAQCLLVIIFHYSNNLHRGISTFNVHQLPYSLIIRCKAQVTHSRFVNHQFVYIISIVFREISSGYNLQSIGIHIIGVTGKHLIQAILLQSIIGTAVGKESRYFLARHSAGESDLIYQRKTCYRFFHSFQFRIQSLGMPRKLDHQCLIGLNSQRLAAHKAQLCKDNQCAAQQYH